MDQEAKAKLDEALTALRGMLRGGSISEDVYYKTAIGLAYEYVMGEEVQEALAIVNSIPISYFENVQAQQMREDEAYRKVASALANKLADFGVAGHFPAEEDLQGWAFTQKPAKA